MLKAVGKSQNELLDEDYKTPKTRDNYKSGETSPGVVLSVDITEYLNGAIARRGSGSGGSGSPRGLGILSSTSSSNLTSRLSGLLGKQSEVTLLRKYFNIYILLIQSK